MYISTTFSITNALLIQELKKRQKDSQKDHLKSKIVHLIRTNRKWNILFRNINITNFQNKTRRVYALMYKR